ncbi:MAG: PIG-L family deacetylase [Candidatus Portnoybacteria bacterium]|nr:PIG-L family deacetylase [Candidatus Portnoybacteria bacterium]
MKNKILAVVAHPDDEVLGPGGALLKHAQAGDEVYCLILGQGAMARTGARLAAVKALRQVAKKAGKILGLKKMFFADFPDNRFDSVSLLDITKKVEEYLERLKPEIIYTHYGDDLNIDHRLAFQAVLTACRPCNENCPKEIYAFETLSSSEWQEPALAFQPNYFVDISDVFGKKTEALKAYASEIRPYPHPRSVEGLKILAQWRGLQSGLRLAEAFCQVRKINVVTGRDNV